jgi:predicted negative regulator of RcsB-dependent stress response
MRAGLTCLLFLLGNAYSSYAKHFEYTYLARNAYEKAISLQFSEAEALVEQIKVHDPDNLIIYHIENYIDCLSLFITEDKEAFLRLKARKKERLAKVELGDPSSPYYLYIQADIRLQWALVRLKFEEYLGTFTDVSKAYKLLQKNEEAFPGFMPNKKDLGLLHALVGTIPDSYKWGVKLLSGLDGTIAEGRQEISDVLQYARHNEFLFEEETLVIYSFLLLHLANEPEQAWQILQKRLFPQKNLLHCFVMSNIAMRTGRNDEAIDLLQHRPQGAAYFPFPFTDYMLGISKLRRLDQDAHQYLLRFLKDYEGENFIKDTYQKLAWHALINGSELGYLQYMSKCEREGKTVTGDDISALNEAKANYVPTSQLVKARLLFDGGYFKQALGTLEQVDYEELDNEKEKLEFLYRKGRILDGLKKYDQAIFYYSLTIQEGRPLPYYFACNAALKAGIIYENRKIFHKAEEFYNDCLTMFPQEHQNSLHHQAKAGLGRMK